MNASIAQNLVVESYMEYVNYACAFIKERAKNGFYNIRLDKNVWSVDSDLNRRIRKELDKMGYSAHFFSGSKSNTAHTCIYW